MTNLHHKNEELVTIDGYQKPGSFVQNIKYLASSEHIETLISQSVECWQYIRYDCFRSRLFNSPCWYFFSSICLFYIHSLSRINVFLFRLATEDNFQPFSWWVSRRNQKMDFWGGAPPGSRKCACGIRDGGTCKNETFWCNCDAGKVSSSCTMLLFFI